MPRPWQHGRVTSPRLDAVGRQIRRRNRRWFILLLMTPAVFGLLAVLAVVTNGPPEPSVKPVSVPTGYRAISDAYFGYAIPSGWTVNRAFSDTNADFFYGTGLSWVGENLRIAKTAPLPGADPPTQLATFGQAGSLPYQLGTARPVTVPGIAVAYQYDVTRPNGFHATALEVWERSSDTDMWLLVHANPSVTTTILASLAGFTAPGR